MSISPEKGDYLFLFKIGYFKDFDFLSIYITFVHRYSELSARIIDLKLSNTEDKSRAIYLKKGDFRHYFKLQICTVCCCTDISASIGARA